MDGSALNHQHHRARGEAQLVNRWTELPRILGVDFDRKTLTLHLCNWLPSSLRDGQLYHLLCISLVYGRYKVCSYDGRYVERLSISHILLKLVSRNIFHGPIGFQKHKGRFGRAGKGCGTTVWRARKLFRKSGLLQYEIWNNNGHLGLDVEPELFICDW